ncbi:MAG: (d)CMP kinase [Spirochaetes bacterium]|nr:(d)CMP kinase [Spirochaetota bacterium]
MKNKRIIVAVDGPAGSGKSSISKEAAKQIGLKYIDSGAVYRAITWYLLQKYNTKLNPKEYINDLSDIAISQIFNIDGSCSSFINGLDISEEIRDIKIADNIGVVSDNIQIRNYVNKLLREWALENSIIMDGRDIGTVVFPDADIKIYLDASVDVRAHRRAVEYREKGKDVDIKDIKKQIALRDKQDLSRPFGCLKKSPDAVYIDTTKMTKNEVIQKVVNLISKLQI